jgi:aldehyde:ferredoxin oxidoreductase
MLKGYNGKILRVDLTGGNIDAASLDEYTARKYIGGVGLAAKILWDETTAATPPLSPDNELVFMTGPLTGSLLPKSSRYIVAGISPLTGIWGQAHAGGRFADELRHAGYDGIIIRGQSTKPVYIWINNGKAEIRDAGHLWRKDTWEVSDILQGETDVRASIACIGVAGEKLVKIAGIMNEGRQGRAAARCGLGALMGSKKLKAIAARGTLSIAYHDETKLKEAVQKILPYCRSRGPEERLAGDMHVFKSFFVYGRVPVKNWSEGSFDEGYVYTETMRDAEPLHCARCPNSCLESYQLKNGQRHMVWEAWGPLGTNCRIANAEVLQQAYTLCNRYGLDTISAGAVIAFAMECFEKGLITSDDTGGIELGWGNHRAMMEILKKIGEREGLGELLGEGVKKAAEHIGGTAPEYAMHVKGLEFPAHEPRALASHALGYATGSIGAAHMEPIGADGLENWMEVDEPRTSPELGFPVALKRFDVEGKGRLVARTQDFSAMLDSITVCLFLSIAHTVTPSHYVRVLNAATGWDMDPDEFMSAGERITNLKRMFSVRRGISGKDDTLPARILTQRLGSGGTRGNIFNLKAMLDEYYAVRGWSQNGIPAREKLLELGLEECLLDT